jgi:hypothetical protein
MQQRVSEHPHHSTTSIRSAETEHFFGANRSVIARLNCTSSDSAPKDCGATNVMVALLERVAAHGDRQDVRRSTTKVSRDRCLARILRLSAEVLGTTTTKRSWNRLSVSLNRLRAPASCHRTAVSKYLLECSVTLIWLPQQKKIIPHHTQQRWHTW